MLIQKRLSDENPFLYSISSSLKVPEKGKDEISWEEGKEGNGRRHKSE